MTDLRDERAAVLTRWHRDLGDNFKAVLPRVLDDLDAIDQAQVPGGIAPAVMTDEEAARFAEQWTANFKGAQPEPTAPTDEQIAAWIERNPEWVRKRNRINGAPPPFDAPAKPATRRRTAR